MMGQEAEKVGETLVADIGGTNSRFAIAGSAVELIDTVTFRNDEFDSFEDVFAAALEKLDHRAVNTVMAVAGPIDSGRAVLTNRGWRIDPLRLEQRFCGINARIVNDFHALACSLPYLQDSGLKTITGDSKSTDGHKLVVGAGTGLGVGFLMRTNQGWQAVPGEGGHVCLPAQTEREIEIFKRLSRGLTRVSAERVLSGPGLVSLYEAVLGISSTPDEPLSPETILKKYSDGDTAAIETAMLFISFLGRVTGDHALTMIPKGGVYIGGGLAPALMTLTGSDQFLVEMRSKGRVSNAINTIPVHIIHEPHAGLIGAAAEAANTQSFELT